MNINVLMAKKYNMGKFILKLINIIKKVKNIARTSMFSNIFH